MRGLGQGRGQGSAPGPHPVPQAPLGSPRAGPVICVPEGVSAAQRRVGAGKDPPADLRGPASKAATLPPTPGEWVKLDFTPTPTPTSRDPLVDLNPACQP